VRDSKIILPKICAVSIFLSSEAGAVATYLFYNMKVSSAILICGATIHVNHMWYGSA